ncbi:2-dehydro-3-deoxy-D-gluconate 5-dehydrogenase [Burkholderiales bacterium]|nr:2-dehydro-3-deoxy-D-gluconate 5-dehydrogenase [Burkholderiales bacterium]
MDETLARLFDLHGRVALVTGGSSGIGRAIAGVLAGAGAHVVVAARRREPVDETVAALIARGGAATGETVDVGNRESIAALVGRLARAPGPIDILVNSAGINLRMPFEEIRDDDWDATIAANLTGPFLLTRALAPAMAARGWGRIVNIASQQAVRAFGNSGAYGASKGALVSLTRSTAERWSSRGVTCNAIVPGFVLTPLTREASADPARVAAMAARTMIGRNGVPDDCRGMALLLASDAGAAITGQALFVDGGFSAT